MGKGKSQVKIINVNDIDVEYLSSKRDKYENLIHYFKVNGINDRLASMIQSGKDKSYLMPMWQTDDGKIIIKIKNKCIKKGFKFEKSSDYLINVSFNYFTISEEVKGYYLKLDSYKTQEEEMDETFFASGDMSEDI